MSLINANETGLYSGADDVCRTLEQRLMFDGAAVATSGDVVITDPVDSPTPAAESSPTQAESTGEVTEATAVPVVDETSEGGTDSHASDPSGSTDEGAAAGEAIQGEATATEVTDVTDTEDILLLDEIAEGNELVIVQFDIQDLDIIINDLEANGKNYVIIDNSEDGIAQFEAAVVSQDQPITALHIISHGDEGSVNLGNTVLNNNTLAAYSDELIEIGSHLTADADILIYGCNVGKDEAFIAELARLTEADIAASDDDTGATEKGGDWVLEVNTGQIDAEIAISVEAQAQWDGILATLINQFEYNGHTYRVYNVPFHLTFAQAEAAAASTSVNGQTGYLAHITNASEQSAVTNAALFDSRIYSAYIGLTDRASEGTWRWVGGPNESFSYQNEDFPGEFTGAGNSSNEDFGIMFGKEWDNQNPGVLTFSRVGLWHSWDDVAIVLGGRDLRTDTYIVEYNALPNAAPNAVNDNYLVNEDQVLSIPAGTGLLNNDSDIDGDAISVSAYDAVSANGATVAVAADGSFTFTPLQDWNGIDTFSYTITDGALFDTATVTINVAAVNDPVTANPDAYVTDQNTVLSISPSGILANDADPDVSDTLVVTSFNTISVGGISVLAGDTLMLGNGWLTVEGDGSFIYDPNSGYDYLAAGESTTVNYNYFVSDQNGSTAETEVIITINGLNDPVIANPDNATTDEDSSINIDVLANDFDVDGDVLTVTNVTTPGNGTVVIEADNTVTYTPDSDFNGIDTFIYTITDGTTTDTAIVTVNVNPTNDPPVAIDDFYNALEDLPLVVDALSGVLINDSDIDGDVLSVNAFDAISVNGGTVTLASDGSFVYVGAENYFGTDTFTYTITDGTLFDTATVIIDVASVNDAPVAVDDPRGGPDNGIGSADDYYTTPFDEPLSVSESLLDNDTDPDGDELFVIRYDFLSDSGGSVFVNPDGTFNYQPPAGFSGVDRFSYTVDDGNGGQDTAFAYIRVLPPPVQKVTSDPVTLTLTPIEPEPIISLNDGIAGFSQPDSAKDAVRSEGFGRFIEFAGSTLIDASNAYIDVLQSNIIEPTVKDTTEDIDELYYNGRPNELVRWQGNEPIQIESDERLALVDALNEQSSVAEASTVTVAMIDEEFQVFMIAQKAAEEANIQLAEKQTKEKASIQIVENTKEPKPDSKMSLVAETPHIKPADGAVMKVSMPSAPSSAFQGLTQQLESADSLELDSQRLLEQANQLRQTLDHPVTP